MLNLFRAAERILFVDMPGYGYKSRVEWGSMVNEYLINNKNLKRVYLLIESERGMKEIDTMIINNLVELAIPFQVVLTKTDKTFKTSEEDFIKLMIKKNQLLIDFLIEKGITCHSDILLTSCSDNNIGLTNLRCSIIEACTITDTKPLFIEQPKVLTKPEKRVLKKKVLEEIRGEKISY